MVNEYLRSFVIGSTYLTTLLFFLTVRNIPDTVKNYSYEDYTLIAPLYLGLMNTLSLYLSKVYNLSLRQRLVLIGLISPLIVISFAYSSSVYNFTMEEWVRYAFRLMLKHFAIYNIVIYFLESNI